MYKCAIIGLGQIGAQFNCLKKNSPKEALNHADCYVAHEHTKLVGGFDTSNENNELFKKKYGVKTFNSIEEMLFDTKPDIVSICSPTHVHFSHINQVLDSGIKMIWAEKPLADSMNGLNELKNKIEGKAAIAVSFQRRYWNNFQKLKDIISSNVLGKAVQIQINYSKTLLTNGCHMIDVACFLTGDKDIKFDKIICAKDKQNPSFRFYANSLPVNVTGIDVDYHCLDISVIFENGRVIIGQNGMESTLEKRTEHEYFPGFYRLKKDEKSLLPTENMKESFYNLLDDLISSFENKREPLSNLNSAILSQNIIEQVNNSL